MKKTYCRLKIARKKPGSNIILVIQFCVGEAGRLPFFKHAIQFFLSVNVKVDVKQFLLNVSLPSALYNIRKIQNYSSIIYFVWHLMVLHCCHSRFCHKRVLTPNFCSISKLLYYSAVCNPRLSQLTCQMSHTYISSPSSIILSSNKRELIRNQNYIRQHIDKEIFYLEHIW